MACITVVVSVEQNGGGISMKCSRWRNCACGVCMGEYKGHCGHYKEPVVPTDNTYTTHCPYSYDSGIQFNDDVTEKK